MAHPPSISCTRSPFSFHIICSFRPRGSSSNLSICHHESRRAVVVRRPRKPQAQWQRWRPHPRRENNDDGGSTAEEVGEVRNVRCEDRRGARSVSVFCQRLVKNVRDIFFYVIDIPYFPRTIRGTNLIQRCQ